VIDLHTHSVHSDGTDPPARVVELAAAAGCSAMALTDHDTLGGLPAAAARADTLGIRLVPGCELSCAFDAHRPHVLVYFVDDPQSPLGIELETMREDRMLRNRRLVARLGELGIDVDYDDVVALAAEEETVGRPHFAQVLVRIGAATSVTDAFDRWLGDGRPAHIERARVSPGEAAELAHRSGGVAVLAHPLTLGLDAEGLDTTLARLAADGLDGVEAVYGRYTPEERAALAEVAARHGLVVTGGSDYHGSMKPDLAVGTGTGDLAVPEHLLDALEARRTS
jgi:3',5'-nucleoside bisphosphate phosphatase